MRKLLILISFCLLFLLSPNSSAISQETDQDFFSDICKLSFTFQCGKSVFSISSYANVHDYNEMVAISWLFSCLAKDLQALGWNNLTAKPISQDNGYVLHYISVKYSPLGNLNLRGDLGSFGLRINYPLGDEVVTNFVVDDKYNKNSGVLSAVKKASALIIEYMDTTNATDDVFASQTEKPKD